LKDKRDLEKKQRNLYGQKRISSLKYQDAEIDLKLSDELTGSLISLKPEGNILMDRYKSFQKRNILESRDKAKFVVFYNYIFIIILFQLLFFFKEIQKILDKEI
jgi:nucleolar protein 53